MYDYEITHYYSLDEENDNVFRLIDGPEDIKINVPRKVYRDYDVIESQDVDKVADAIGDNPGMIMMMLCDYEDDKSLKNMATSRYMIEKAKAMFTKSELYDASRYEEEMKQLQERGILDDHVREFVIKGKADYSDFRNGIMDPEFPEIERIQKFKYRYKIGLGMNMKRIEGLIRECRMIVWSQMYELYMGTDVYEMPDYFTVTLEASIKQSKLLNYYLSVVKRKNLDFIISIADLHTLPLRKHYDNVIRFIKLKHSAEWFGRLIDILLVRSGIESNPGPVQQDFINDCQSVEMKIIKLKQTCLHLIRRKAAYVRDNEAKGLVDQAVMKHFNDLMQWNADLLDLYKKYPQFEKFEMADGEVVEPQLPPPSATGGVADEPVQNSDTVLPKTTEGENVADVPAFIDREMYNGDISDFPVQVQKQTGRAIRFRHIALGEAVPRGPLFAIALPLDLLIEQSNAPNFLNFQIHDFVRMNLEIIMNLVITKYTRVGIRVVWFPHLLEHDDVNSYINPYTISQMPGMFINSATAQRGSLMVDFKSFLNSIPIPRSDLVNTLYMGTLLGYIYNPVSSVSGENSQTYLDLYASLRDADFYVQRYRTDPVSMEVIPPCVDPNRAIFEGPIGMAVGVAQALSAATARLLAPVDRILGITKNVADYFNLDRPTLPDANDALYMKSIQPMCHGDGIAREEVMRLNPVAREPQVMRVDELMSYEKLAQVPSYIGTFQLSSDMVVGTKVFECLVSPCIVNPIRTTANLVVGNEGVKSWATVDHVAEDFVFFTGDMIFRFQNVVNGFDVYALRCVYNPNQNSTNYCDVQNLENRVFEIGPSLDKEVDFTMECKYKANVPMLRTKNLRNTQINMGVLSVFLERELVLGDPVKVEVNVYKYAAPNIQFSVPDRNLTLALSNVDVSRNVEVSFDKTGSLFNQLVFRQGANSQEMNWITYLRVPGFEIISSGELKFLDETTNNDVFMYDVVTKNLVRVIPREGYLNQLTKSVQTLQFSSFFNIGVISVPGFSNTTEIDFAAQILRQTNSAGVINESPFVLGTDSMLITLPDITPYYYFNVYNDGCQVLLARNVETGENYRPDTWSVRSLPTVSAFLQAFDVPGWEQQYIGEVTITGLNVASTDLPFIVTPRPVASFEMESGRPIDSRKLYHDVPVVQEGFRQRTAHLISGETFELKNVLRRKEIYGEWDVTVADLNRRTVVLTIPVTTGTVSNRNTVIDEQLASKMIKYSDAFRFFRGPLRFRIIISSNQEMISSHFFVNHQADQYPVLDSASQKIQATDKSVFSSAVVQMTPRQNLTHDIEVPFYTGYHMLINSSYTNIGKDMINSATSLGNLELSYLGPARDFTVTVLRSFGDTSSFNTFVGFPERKLYAEGAEPKSLLVQGRPPVETLVTQNPDVGEMLLIMSGIEPNPGPIMSVFAKTTEDSIKNAADKISNSSDQLSAVIELMKGFLTKLAPAKAITSKVAKISLSLLQAIMNPSISVFAISFAQILLELEIVSFGWVVRVKDSIFNYFTASAESPSKTNVGFVGLISTIITAISSNFGCKVPDGAGFITRTCSKLTWMANVQSKMAQMFQVILDCVHSVVNYIRYRKQPKDLARESLEKKIAPYTSWYKCVLKLTDQMNVMHILADDYWVEYVDDLYKKGQEIKQFFCTDPDLKDIWMSSIRFDIMNCFAKLDKLKKMIAGRRPVEGRRYEPYCIYLAGEAGAGKTTCMRDLIDAMLEAVDGKVNGENIYEISWANEFMNGLNAQRAYIMDEFLDSEVTETSRKQVEMFKSLKSSSPFNAVMAELEDKTLMCNPLILGVISNTKSLTHKDYKFDEPMRRRRDICIEARQNPNLESCSTCKRFTISCLECRTINRQKGKHFTSFRRCRNDEAMTPIHNEMWVNFESIKNTVVNHFKQYDMNEICKLNSTSRHRKPDRTSYKQASTDVAIKFIEEMEAERKKFDEGYNDEYRNLFTDNPKFENDYPFYYSGLEAQEVTDVQLIQEETEETFEKWLIVFSEYIGSTYDQKWKNYFMSILMIITTLSMSLGIQYPWKFATRILDNLVGKVRNKVIDLGSLDGIEIDQILNDNCTDIVVDKDCLHSLLTNDAICDERCWYQPVGYDGKYIEIPMYVRCREMTEVRFFYRSHNGTFEYDDSRVMKIETCGMGRSYYRTLCHDWIDNNISEVKKMKTNPPHLKTSTVFRATSFYNKLKIQLNELKTKRECGEWTILDLASSFIAAMLYVLGAFLIILGVARAGDWAMGGLKHKFKWAKAEIGPNEEGYYETEITDLPENDPLVIKTKERVANGIYEMNNISGDNLTRKPKSKPKSKGKSRMSMAKYENSNGFDVRDKIRKNTYFLECIVGNIRYNFRVLALGSNCYIANKHSWDIAVRAFEFKFYCVMNKLVMREIKPSNVVANVCVLNNKPTDLVVLTINAQNMNPDISGLFLSEDDEPSWNDLSLVTIDTDGKLNSTDVKAQAFRDQAFNDLGIYMTEGYMYTKRGNGLCNSFLFDNKKGKILSLHSVGCGNYGYGHRLTKEDVEMVLNGLPMPVTQHLVTSEAQDATCEAPYGTIVSEIKPPYLNTKTEIRETNFIEFKKVNYPAVLSFAGESYPGQKAFDAAHEKQSVLVSEFDREVMSQVVGYLKELYRVNCKPVRIPVSGKIDLQEAIFGADDEYFVPIRLDTGAGYPYSMDVKAHGKFHLIDFDEPIGSRRRLKSLDQRLLKDINDIEKSAENGIILKQPFMATLKDERLPVRKMYTPRIIDGSPIQLSIPLIQYTREFVAAFYKNRNGLYHQVGIDIHSPEFEFLYKRLKRFPNVFSMDVKSLGPTLPRGVSLACISVINSWYENYGDDRSYVRQNLLLGEVDTIEVYYDKLIELAGGSPSGSTLTVVRNTMACLIYIMVAFTELTGLDIYDFDNHCVCYGYGDDWVISISDEIKDNFNFISLKTFLKNYNIQITMSDKTADDQEFLDFGTIDFLKNKFGLSKTLNGRVVPIRDRTLIEDTMCWYRKSFDAENIGMTARSALLFAYYHGPEYFNDLRNRIISAMDSVGMQYMLPDYNHFKSEFIKKYIM